MSIVSCWKRLTNFRREKEPLIFFVSENRRGNSSTVHFSPSGICAYTIRTYFTLAQESTSGSDQFLFIRMLNNTYGNHKNRTLGIMGGDSVTHIA